MEAQFLTDLLICLMGTWGLFCLDHLFTLPVKSESPHICYEQMSSKEQEPENPRGTKAISVADSSFYRLRSHAVCPGQIPKPTPFLPLLYYFKNRLSESWKEVIFRHNFEVYQQASTPKFL